MATEGCYIARHFWYGTLYSCFRVSARAVQLSMSQGCFRNTHRVNSSSVSSPRPTEFGGVGRLWRWQLLLVNDGLFHPAYLYIPAREEACWGIVAAYFIEEAGDGMVVTPRPNLLTPVWCINSSVELSPRALILVVKLLSAICLVVIWIFNIFW